MNIFSQPVELARRTVEYGHQKSYRDIIARAMHEDDMIRYPLRRGKQLVDWLLRR